MWLLILPNQVLLINGVDWALYFEPQRPQRKNMFAHLAAVQLDRVMDREEVARPIVDSAAAIHTALGPGLLESLYRRCLMYELGLRGLDVQAEYPIPIRYKEVVLDCGYRAQLLTYLKLSGRSVGFLISWKVPRIKDGIQRMIWQKR
jgi:hypothetical protein